MSFLAEFAKLNYPEAVAAEMIDLGKMSFELIKKAQREARRCRKYFWRNYDQQEVDFIEEENGELRAYEFKYTAPKAKFPKTFKENYKTSLHLINRENFMEWFGK